MQLINQATAGIDKQIKDLELAIKELKAEKREMLKDFGVTEHPLKTIIKGYPRVSKLKIPSDQECDTLIRLHGEKEVIEMLGKMENYKPLLKNYTTIYLTATNWFKRDLIKAVPTGNVIKNEAWTKVRDEIRGSGVDKAEYKKGWLTGELK